MPHAHRLLLVDGSDATRKMIGQLLRKQRPDIDVACCTTAQEALEACAQTAYDVISTSVALSDMDGLELAQRIHLLPMQQNSRLLMVSGDSTAIANAKQHNYISGFFDKSEGIAALTRFLVEQVPEPAVVDDPTSANAALYKARILYVEDSATAALAMRRILEQHDYDVTHVTDAENALHLLEKHRDYDLLISDMFLPGDMNGADLIHTIRHNLQINQRQLPIIIVTIEGQKETEIGHLVNMGANGLITKPIEEQTVLQCLKQWAA